jgi:hypothetical protein
LPLEFAAPSLRDYALAAAVVAFVAVCFRRPNV